LQSGEFNWNGQERGLVLGAFFYGYILTQLPGGYLAGRLVQDSLFYVVDHFNPQKNGQIWTCILKNESNYCNRRKCVLGARFFWS